MGVKTGGGLLQQQVRALEIECLPQNLPDVLHVDVSALNIGDSIHVKDIGYHASQGVTALAEGDITRFLVSEPTVAEEPAAGEAAAAPKSSTRRSRKLKAPRRSNFRRAWRADFASWPDSATLAVNMSEPATTWVSWSWTRLHAVPPPVSRMSRNGMQTLPRG